MEDDTTLFKASLAKVDGNEEVYTSLEVEHSPLPPPAPDPSRKSHTTDNTPPPPAQPPPNNDEIVVETVNEEEEEEETYEQILPPGDENQGHVTWTAGPAHAAQACHLWVQQQQGEIDTTPSDHEGFSVTESDNVTTVKEVVEQLVTPSSILDQVDLDHDFKQSVRELVHLPQVHLVDQSQDQVMLTRQQVNLHQPNRGALGDMGANINMCNNLDDLHEIEEITPFPVGLAAEGTPSLCTHKGLYTIHDDRTGSPLDVTMYYNKDGNGIILSPSAIIAESDMFESCSQTIYKDSRPGTLKFRSSSGLYSFTMTLVKRNGLYYTKTPQYKMVYSILGLEDEDDAFFDDLDIETQKEEVNAVRSGRPQYHPVRPHKQAESELWSLRLGNPSETQMQLLGKSADGIPSKFEFHPFRQIDWKTQAGIRKKAAKKTADHVHQRGKRYYMDFGFMRASASDYTRRKKDVDRVVESFDGYSSYLLIVDEHSRHVWTLLTKSKEPPIRWVNLFLAINGCPDGGVIRCDQGGELASSHDFISSVMEENKYAVEPTGADSPSQNGAVEKWNDVLAVTVRSLLYGAGLDARFWSQALLHAVYLHNRRVHSATQTTPYEAWYGKRPNLKNLKIFGSRVCVKVSGHRPAKLDKHHFDGIFLGFSATDANIRYLDLNSGRLKICHHAYFDESWYLQATRPPAAQLLYDLGLDFQQPAPPLQRTTSDSLPVAPQPPLPNNTKGLSKSQVGRAVNLPLPLRLGATPNPVGARAAAVDSSYYKNTALDPAKYSALFEHYQVSQTDLLQVYMSSDPYGDDVIRTLPLRGLQSCRHKAAGIGLKEENGRLLLEHMVKSTPAAKIPRWRSELKGAWLKSVHGHEVKTIADVHRVFDDLSRLELKECELIFAKLEVKQSLTEEGIPQVNIDQINPRPHLSGGPLIPNIPIQRQTPPPPIADELGGVLLDGLPSVNKLTRGKWLKSEDKDEWVQSEYEQLNQYLQQGMFGKIVKISELENEFRQKQMETDEERKQLGSDERKQLDNKRATLAELGIFRLVWTYQEKLSGDTKMRKKSRCAVDGSPKTGAAQVIGNVYANCIEQSAARLFYAITAAENLLMYGGDVRNAFAEAPPPEQAFYIKPDRAFQEWWVNHLGRPPIADDEVLTGQHCWQGHPQASRQWDKHSDSILRRIGFTPTTHEPCLYSGIIENERVLFMRQVDDFIVSAPSERIANIVYDMIDEHITFPIKRLGLATLFNGVDIDQTAEYIKISVESFLDKIMPKHLEQWIQHAPALAERPIPLPTTPAFIKSFLTADGDRLPNGQPDPAYQRKMEKESKLPASYRSAIGECTYAMATCRPDIAHAVVKLAQFSVCPHQIHYHGVKHLLKYLYYTKSDGIYFWREKEHPLLPKKERPIINSNKNDLLYDKREEYGPKELNASADSDWATCPKTRRSFSGMCVKLAGGIIAYKSRLQTVIAQSSTEAELVAANDVGKMILYIRSIMWDLGIPQMAATVIGEDNDACTAIGNAQKTTARTRHVDIKQRAIADWIERDLLILRRVDTSVNESDLMTKLLGRILFHRHNDYILGHVPPRYTRAYKEYFGTGFKVQQNTGETETNALLHRKENPTTADKYQVNSLLAKWNQICLYKDDDIVQSNINFRY